MQVPILIVGAGPAGLCSSILLSRLGVRSLVVERHASTSIHPKATGISTRTMELFRSWGIERRIREAAMSVRFSSSVRDNLSGPELERRSLGYPTADEAAAFSPTWAAVLAQDHLEPILLDHARSYPAAEVRFSTEVVDLEQTETGVRATIVDRLTGARTEIWSRYLVAADGVSSPIRRRLGIATHGVERIGEYLSILFRADIDSIVGPDRSGLYMLQGLGGPAPSVALPTSDDGRWLLATPWRSDVRPIATLGPDDFVGIVRRAAGRPDLEVEVLDCQLVEIGAEVAERFRDGNVFLVGDAAHRTAPTGGTGMNTAIQSAHNLMWKLAAVLSGNAGDALLDSLRSGAASIRRAERSALARAAAGRVRPGGGPGRRVLVRRHRGRGRARTAGRDRADRAGVCRQSRAARLDRGPRRSEVDAGSVRNECRAA